MFRRISGSSSITNIFFMNRFEKWKGDDDGCAFANFARESHPAAVQVSAAFHQHQAQSSARAGPHICAAVKRGKEFLLILVRNSNSPVADGTDGLLAVALEHEMNGFPGL